MCLKFSRAASAEVVFRATAPVIITGGTPKAVMICSDTNRACSVCRVSIRDGTVASGLHPGGNTVKLSVNLDWVLGTYPMVMVPGRAPCRMTPLVFPVADRTVAIGRALRTVSCVF